jgi:hypothetical protein
MGLKTNDPIQSRTDPRELDLFPELNLKLEVATH